MWSYDSVLFVAMQKKYRYIIHSFICSFVRFFMVWHSVMAVGFVFTRTVAKEGWGEKGRRWPCRNVVCVAYRLFPFRLFQLFRRHHPFVALDLPKGTPVGSHSSISISIPTRVFLFLFPPPFFIPTTYRLVPFFLFLSFFIHSFIHSIVPSSRRRSQPNLRRRTLIGIYRIPSSSRHGPARRLPLQRLLCLGSNRRTLRHGQFINTRHHGRRLHIQRFLRHGRRHGNGSRPFHNLVHPVHGVAGEFDHDACLAVVLDNLVVEFYYPFFQQLELGVVHGRTLLADAVPEFFNGPEQLVFAAVTAFQVGLGYAEPESHEFEHFLHFFNGVLFLYVIDVVLAVAAVIATVHVMVGGGW